MVIMVAAICFIRANVGYWHSAIRNKNDHMQATDYAFRMRFTDLCARTINVLLILNKMPAWMKDFRDMNFFGEPDWANDY
jgi:hypothetical protein